MWRNISDLQVGDSLALGFSAATDPAVLPVGATFINDGSAYAHSDPRRIPAFSAAGVVTPGSYTGSAAATSAPTTVSALEITKSEPSPESELLRGIHEHPTVYTLTVRSTGVAPSTGVVPSAADRRRGAAGRPCGCAPCSAAVRRGRRRL